MSFMRKFLNLLDMNNWENGKYSNPDSCEISGHVSSNNSNYSCDILHFYKIKNYWSITPYRHTERKYRVSTAKEKKEYALIDILSCFSKGARNKNNFSPNLLQELGITNWNNYFNFLWNKGYLRNANINEILIEKYSLNDLKTIADSVGVKKNGKKAELVERIIPLLSEEQIAEIKTSPKLYTLSPKGEQVLCGNEDYMLLHKYRYIVSLAEFNDNRMPDGIHKRNFYDTVFQVLSNQAFWQQSHKEFDLLSITYFRIYQLLMEEEKKTQHNVPHDVALNNYVEYLYLHTCQCYYMAMAVQSKIFPSNSISLLFTIPQIDAHVYKLANSESYINYDLIFCSNPPSLFTEDEFKTFIHEILTAPMFDIQNWNELLTKRVKEFFNFIK